MLLKLRLPPSFRPQCSRTGACSLFPSLIGRAPSAPFFHRCCWVFFMLHHYPCGRFPSSVILHRGAASALTGPVLRPGSPVLLLCFCIFGWRHQQPFAALPPGFVPSRPERKISYNRRCPHLIVSTPNPYEQAISITGRTSSVFDEDNLIPCFGFGDGGIQLLPR